MVVPRGWRFLVWSFVALSLAVAPLSVVTAQQADVRYFPQTGYRIAADPFWTYFNRRGGARNFGYPVSNAFTLSGFQVQVFQRAVLQLQPDGSVAMMNLLDDGMLPYTRINGSVFPSIDPRVLKGQPEVGTPDYHARALQFVKDNAPDTWNGMKVNFFQTFATSVRPDEAFPNGGGSAGLLLGFNLEIWGLPTSKPMADPTNSGFVYQRFQRGIMHYDESCTCTQGLLLADYVKALLTLRNLPADLGADAARSPLYAQFDPASPAWLRRPADLPGSDLTNAFRRDATVFIDAGHGGKEIGASYRFEDGKTMVEKDVNLEVATRLARTLRESGFGVVMSRTADIQANTTRDLNGDGKVNLTDDLQARLDTANGLKADLLVSVHFNGIADPTKRGTQMFYAQGRPFSDRNQTLAQLAQQSLVKSLKQAGYDTLDRGATTDSRVLGEGNHYYLLGPKSDVIARPSEMPGIIGEPLYVTNPDDAKALRQDKVLDAVARGYAEAVSAYFQKYPVP
ncbi:MAG: N-acetylmuramoyl-L-alanine amidase [Chloroflexi bacterium]|nr:N-acetylmuramoyl-L-alanine amidase [Chloroflexota bacterium]